MYALPKPFARSGSCQLLAVLIVVVSACSTEGAQAPASPDSGFPADVAVDEPAVAPGLQSAASSVPASSAPSPDAAGQTPPPSEEVNVDAPAGLSPENSIDATGRIVAACHGLQLVGMKYSPGGTTLPN